MFTRRSLITSYVFVTLSFISYQLIDAKGFGGSRGSGGFKGGVAKGPGTFGGSASYNRPSAYGTNIAKGRSGSGLKNAAVGFVAGAAGGVAAYSLMRAMSGSSGGYQPGYYRPGYGYGKTCYNNENFNGTVFGQFRCPMNDFPLEARECCGDYGKQFCCIPDSSSTRAFNGMSYLFWVIIIVILFVIIALIWVRYQRRQREEVILVPTEAPIIDGKGPAAYQPPPPPMGYPPPPQGNGNPYVPPPQYSTQYNMNPYEQQPYPMAYPPQQPGYPMAYPPQQQQQPMPPYPPYQGGPSY